MKVLPASEAFQAELPGWALRGALCAASSAVWAVLMGFQSPAEIAGMTVGVAFWVAVFSGMCVRPPRVACLARLPLVPALRWAAWTKIGLTASAWLVYAAAGAIGSADLMQMAMFGAVDMLLGLAALAFIAWVGGMAGPDKIAAADSFGWTALTTVTEGALMAVVIVGLTLVLLIGWRLGHAVGWSWNLSPVRRAD